jgi:STE24 endopeptidase
MTLILLASNVSRGYERELRRWTGILWAPDLALGLVAGVVFLAAPMLLRHIWRTTPLPAGPLRSRLEALCRRIGLRCRDVLVWKSDGLMINAAVMGVLAPVRYVLLSDALLASMTTRQVEAVFGHEAGHVRHRHIQHFLVFAFVGWVAVAGLMELLARGSMENGGAWAISFVAIEGVGVVATIAFWTLGFGWVSRRFERQADLYGARCVTPDATKCDRPCGVHLDEEQAAPTDGRICSTAASVFASALHRVAALNGIPTEERSWRHSSIASRIRFLTSLAGDPARARSFERSVERVKLALVTAAVIGAFATVAYLRAVPRPALSRFQSNVTASHFSPE